MPTLLEDYDNLASTAAVLQAALPEFKVTAKGASSRGEGPFKVNEPPYLSVQLPAGMERLRPALMQEIKQRTGLSMVADEQAGALRTAPGAAVDVIKTVVLDVLNEDPADLSKGFDTLTLEVLRLRSARPQPAGERPSDSFRR